MIYQFQRVLGLLMSTLTLYFAATFGSDQPIIGMAAGMYQINTTQLPRFTFDGDNRLDFLQGFPDVAAHFGFSELIDRDRPLARPGDDGEQDVEWDRLNNLALSKLKFYVTPSVHAIIWKGERLIAAQYYSRLWVCSWGVMLRQYSPWRLHGMDVPSARTRPCWHVGKV